MLHRVCRPPHVPDLTPADRTTRRSGNRDILKMQDNKERHL